MKKKSKNISKISVEQKKGKDFWGPPVWTSLHIFSATFKSENAQAYITFLHTLTFLIPCDECKTHFKEILQILPINSYLTNNHDCFFLSYIIHDMVNENATKHHPEVPPKESPNYDEIKAYYFNSLYQECKECQL